MKQQFAAKHPWTILAAGAAIQVLTGIPAAWGVFQQPVMEEYGLSEQGAGYAFGILIAAFGVGCVLGGFLQDSRGPRCAALWGTALLCGGFFAAAMLPGGSAGSFFLAFSIPAGLGTAFLYPSIQSCAQKWYAGRKGLATGVIGGAVGLSGAFLTVFVRTAVSGFNRTDVVNYIESTSIEHQKALRKLTDERDKLAAENAQLQTQLTGLQARLIQVQADNDALTEQVNTLAQEGSDLAEQLKAAEAARAEAAAQPQPAPEAGPIEEEPAAETPEAPAQEPSLTEKELTAYRRAEQTERNAAVRARRIYAQLSNLCEDARTRYMDSGEEIAALAADLSTGLSRLQDAFAEVQVIFDDAQNAFDDMQLPETAAEETAE